MVAIGEKCETLKKLRAEASKKSKHIKEQQTQLKEIQKNISELMKSQLPIRVITALEDNSPKSHDLGMGTTHVVVFLLPDIDRVRTCRRYDKPTEPIYDNEIDLTGFYDSGHNTYGAEIPYGKSFDKSEEYRSVIDSAIADVMSRLARILAKNENITDWNLVGKLLIASYYNL